MPFHSTDDDLEDIDGVRIIVPDEKERMLFHRISRKLTLLDMELTAVDSGVKVQRSEVMRFDMHDSHKKDALNNAHDLIKEVSGMVFDLSEHGLFLIMLEQLIDRRIRYFNILRCGYFD